MKTVYLDLQECKPEEVIDTLTYINYRHNRTISPDTTPVQWEKVYGPKTMAMEERLQAERANG